MKNLFPFFLLGIVYFAFSCESGPIVGSEEVIELRGAKFFVDTTYVENNRFYASGTVKNSGIERFSPIWYVEGAFFSDSNQSVKLGGGNTSFSFALEKGQTTIWKIYFSDSDINPYSYPDFTVSELRAFKEKTTD